MGGVRGHRPRYWRDIRHYINYINDLRTVGFPAGLSDVLLWRASLACPDEDVWAYVFLGDHVGPAGFELPAVPSCF
jgi:hypothetical protein